MTSSAQLCECSARSASPKARTQLWHLTALAALALVLLSGCDDSRARLFSVTVLEPLTIECTGTTNSTEFDEDTLEAAANEVRRAWKNEKELYPPTPQGRVLHVIEVQSDMRAWFEKAAFSNDATTGPGALVFHGEAQDDFIEGYHETVENTDDEDEDQGKVLCGPRPLTIGTLSATDVDGSLLGRLRWEIRTYYKTNDSSCAALVSCIRDVSVWGAEQ